MGSNTSSPMVTPANHAVRLEKHLRVRYITEPHPIKNRTWRGVRLETERDHLTIAELANFLTKLLEEHPEFADTCVECAEDEFATSVEVRESGMTLH